MQDIGQELQKAREEKGLTLEELSSRTLIAKKYLRALESGEFDVFPGEVYLKGAMRKVATEVGLDPEPLLKRYAGTDAAENAQGVIDESSEKKEILGMSAVVKNYNTVRRVNKGRLAIVVLVLLLLIVGIRAISDMISADPTISDLPPISDNEGNDNNQSADENPTEEEDPEESVEPEEPEIRIEQEDISGGVLFTVYHADELDVELSFTGRCWVLAHTDGTQDFEITFSAGQKRSVTAESKMRIRFGAANAVDLEVNGEPIELPERNGNTYNVEFVLAQE